jgi:hypothetical protein
MTSSYRAVMFNLKIKLDEKSLTNLEVEWCPHIHPALGLRCLYWERSEKINLQNTITGGYNYVEKERNQKCCKCSN